jgi:hypothetical protein
MSPFSRPAIDQPKIVGDVQQVRLQSNAAVIMGEGGGGGWHERVVLRFVVFLFSSLTDSF